MQRTDGEQHVVGGDGRGARPARAAGGRRAIVALPGTRYGERNGAAVELAALLDVGLLADPAR